MKKSMLNFGLAALFLTGIFAACDNKHEADSAREQSNEANKNAEEAKQDVDHAKTREDMASYKAEKLEKIADNERKIAELREKQKTSGKTMDKVYQERIENLEKRNAELREKLNNYQDADNAKWEEFKREFNHDMDELGKSMGDMGKDNVK